MRSALFRVFTHRRAVVSWQRFGTTCRSPSARVTQSMKNAFSLDCLALHDGTDRSVRYYRTTLRKISKERRSNFRRGGSLKTVLCTCRLKNIVHRRSNSAVFVKNVGRNSSVGIATGYGLDGPGIESRWQAIFSSPVQTGPGAHPASCTMGTASFPAVKSGRGVTLTPHLLLVPWSWKGRAIPLLPLWAVRPVQSLSACTKVTFTLPTVLCSTVYDSGDILCTFLWCLLCCV